MRPAGVTLILNVVTRGGIVKCVYITYDSKQIQYLFKFGPEKWTKLAHNAEVFSFRYLLNGFRWNFMFGVCGENRWKNDFFRIGRVETLSYMNTSCDLIYCYKTPRGLKIDLDYGSHDIYSLFSGTLCDITE